MKDKSTPPSFPLSRKPYAVRSLEQAVALSSLVSPAVAISRSGELCASFRLAGVPFEAADDAKLAADAAALNLLYRSLPAGSTVLCHRIRRRFTDALMLPAEPGFARHFARSLNERTGGALMRTEFYATLVSPPAPGSRRTRALLSPEERKAALRARLAAFEELASGFGRALARFGAERLGAYHWNGVLHSSQLELYNALLTLSWQPVRVPSGPLWAALGNASAWFGPDAIEIETAAGRRYACGIELKDFCQATEPGLLDALLYPDFGSGAAQPEFIETQAFRVMGRAEGMRFLKLQQGQLIAAADAGASQIEALTEAMDGLASGEFAMGEYAYGLLVASDTEAGARRAAADAAEKLKSAGLLPCRSTLALPGLYFSSLPCRMEDAPRVARVTSVNFAHFAPFHAIACGKRDGNPWGEALLLMRTPAGDPFYFSFHATPKEKDASGAMALGNAVVIGTSGSGKTVFLNACAALAQKYRTPKTPFTLVFFDKDRGAEAAVRALPASAYFTFEAGRPSGMNPFALPPTEENLAFLTDLTRLMLEGTGGPMTPAELLQLAFAVRSVMSLPKEERRLAALLQSLVTGSRRDAGTVALRLSRWIEGGELAWVFDNASDSIDFAAHENIGIDGTEFLENPEVRGPVAFYLLHKMERAMDGRRFIFFMDEFWKWLKSDAFRGFAANKLKTIRKQNGLGVFATQSPSDIASSPIARDVAEQCATQVFLPNPRAAEDDYMGCFRLTREEYEIVRRLPESSRAMLVRQDGRSAVATLDLSAFPEALALFSGGSGSVRVLESLTGTEPESRLVPEAWLPKYFEATLGNRKGEPA